MKTKKGIIIIGILVVMLCIVLCSKQCGNSQAEQAESVMTETGTAEAVPVITEASLAAAEDRTESAGSSQNSTADKTDKTDKTNEAEKMNEAEPESMNHISIVDTVGTQEDGSKDNGTEELNVEGNVERSGENIFSSNVESLSDNDIQPTETSAEEAGTIPAVPDETIGEVEQESSSSASENDTQPTEPSAEEAGTIPAVPDETIGEGEQGSVPSAFELAQNDSMIDYEYYLNGMTPEEKQELFDSAPSPREFLSWVNKLRDEYNAARKGKITDAEAGISFD